MTRPTITLDNLLELVEHGEWTHSQQHNEIERTTRLDTIEGDWNPDDGCYDIYDVDIKCAWGFAGIVSRCGDVTITYDESYNYDLHAPESLTTGTDGQDFVWSCSHQIIDDDGDDMSDEALGDYLPLEFCAPDYDFIDVHQTADIDEDTMSDDNIITLENDNAPDVRFTGDKIGSTSSFDPISGPQNTRWTEIDLYRTAGGTWIAHVVGRTKWQGESTRYRVHVCTTDAEMIDALGHGWLAKDIYEAAGIDATQHVE